MVIASGSPRNHERPDESTPSAQSEEDCTAHLSAVDRRLLPNALWVHARVLSGGQPQGEAGYAELQRLGIRTIISVDGIRPDLEAAHEHRLQLIHLPHGYDGITAARRQELAHAVLTAPGPTYVHCHHGVHRSPAAAAVGCIVAGLISRDAGINVLRQAGTSEDYTGLWDSVRQAAPGNLEQLAALQIRFTEFEPPPPIVDAMGRLESIMEQLENQLSVGPDDRDSTSDPSAGSQALLLKEEFTEMGRMDSVQDQPEEFRRLLTTSEDQAALLIAVLKSGNRDAVEQPPPGTILRKIRQQCRTCHRQFRD